jgi:hypothetical protein
MRGVDMSRHRRDCTRSVTFALALFATLVPFRPALAYHSNDVERVAAPPGAGLKLLRGFNTRTGQLADTCITASGAKVERGAGQPGVRDFKLIHSVHEILSERDLSVAAELSVGFGIGGASLSVEQSFYKQHSSSVENGAAYAYFLDYEAPVFADSSAGYRLTEDAAALYEKSVRGRLEAFAKTCGDAVMVGSEAARSFQGIATLSKTETHSEESRKTSVQLAARYMGAALKGSVAQMGKTREDAESLDLQVSYIASGDAQLRGATNLRQFARAFRDFQVKDKTTDVIFIYVIPYEKLLARSEFDLGIPKAQMRQVRAIMNGIQRVELARNAARTEASEAASEGARERAQVSRQFLARELKMLKAAFRSADGCVDEFSAACTNLHARLARGPGIRDRKQLAGFVSKAIASAKSCPSGYPFSKPDGFAVCGQCRAGEEPVFRDGHEGACGYLPEASRPKNAKRLFMKELRQERKTQLEAGVWGTVVSYPNFEPKRCQENCRSKAADAVCESQGLGRAMGFELWNPVADDLGDQPRAFFYPNGDPCIPSRPGAFEPVRCKTFKYVDCAVTGPTSAKSE